MPILRPADALARLREGNQRYVAGEVTHGTLADHAFRDDLVMGQEPFAVVLGCSDSRVPAEIVFDQGLGELFVVRVAGNVAASSQIGSIEFAVEKFGTRVVVVLGHSGCGAVSATLDAIVHGVEIRSPNVRSIVELVRPVVDAALADGEEADRDELTERVVRANVEASVAALRSQSELLRNRMDEGRLLVVGAEYSLVTGEVEFLESSSSV